MITTIGAHTLVCHSANNVAEALSSQENVGLRTIKLSVPAPLLTQEPPHCSGHNKTIESSIPFQQGQQLIWKKELVSILCFEEQRRHPFNLCSSCDSITVYKCPVVKHWRKTSNITFFNFVLSILWSTMKVLKKYVLKRTFLMKQTFKINTCVI